MTCALTGGTRPACSPAQKWSKGKAREKLSNAVLFDAKTFDRLMKEVPKVRGWPRGWVRVL